MPWLKSSDKSGLHPLVLAVRRAFRADERSVNEVYGFVSRCATLSAGFMTDYVVDIGTAELVGGDRTQVLLRQAGEAGLLVAEGRGRNRTWRIVEDDDLWHIRAREDVLWDRQRDQDRRNPELTARVLMRDGDQCRYCRVVLVSSKDTRSGRGATYDHLVPGAAATFDTYVRCCVRCNSRFKELPRHEKEKHLLPPPPLPYFAAKSQSRSKVEAFLGHRVHAANDPFTDAAPASPPSSSGGPAAVGATSDREPAAVGATPTAPEPAAAGATRAEQGGTAAAGATSQPGTAAAGATPEHPGGAPPGAGSGPPWSEGGRRDGPGLGPGPGLDEDGAGGASLPSSGSSARRGSRARRGGSR
ncbi:MAG: hypothetical protein IE926_01825 [Micrococcales bacterium]|nr:hypothetical protein [Micrococcales bacterium]